MAHDDTRTDVPVWDIDRDLRITFAQDANIERLSRGRAATDQVTGRESRSRSRRRSVSRDSISSRFASSPYSGVPIEYRTLSIQVDESQQVDKDNSAEVKAVNKSDHDYFANLEFHRLGDGQLCQLNVAVDQGLSGSAAATRLQRDGKNILLQPRTNYIKKILLYVFGGFCSVLWVGVVIFFICWRPLSNPPSPTNLALGILVIIVSVLQAGFSAF